jgi:hypothetical protein
MLAFAGMRALIIPGTVIVMMRVAYGRPQRFRV